MFLLKSHIKQHTRKTKSGGVAVVREHEDKRVASLAPHIRERYDKLMHRANTDADPEEREDARRSAQRLLERLGDDNPERAHQQEHIRSTVSTAWSAAFRSRKKFPLGSDIQPQVEDALAVFRQHMPDVKYTYNQMWSALVSDKFKTGMDSMDYLRDIAEKQAGIFKPDPKPTGRRGRINLGNLGKALIKSHILAYDRHLQSGRVVHVKDHDDKRTAQEAIIAPNGRDNFGSIQGEIAAAAKIPPGPIKLFKGSQMAQHHGYGKEHMEAQHGEEIRKAGYNGPEDFVADVIRNVSALYQVGENRFAMVADGRQQKIHIVELRHEAGKQFYSIVTGYIVERSDFAKRGHKLLWKKGMRKGLLQMFLLQKSHVKGHTRKTKIQKSSGETEIKVRLNDRDGSLVRLLKELRLRANPGHSFEVHIDPDAGKESGRCGFDGDGGFHVGDIEVNGELVKSHVTGHLRTERSGKVTQVHDYDDKRQKRFEARSLEGTKWHHPQGHTRGEGHGVYDNEKQSFIADKGKHHPWDYKKPGVAKDIATDLNTHGPAAELHYGRPHQEKPKSLLIDLPSGLRKKCERAEPGKGGEITLLQTEAAILLNKGLFGLISAGRNPNIPEDKALTDEEINMRTEHLKQDLVDKGLKFVKVRGKYGEEEDSFMCLSPDMTKDEAVELGAKHNQDSIIYADHGHNELIYTTGGHKGEKHVGDGYDNLPDSEEDFFTELDTGEGKKMKFILHFDFNTFVKALKGFASWLLEKAHIHTYSRKTESGRVSIVREHDDSRKPSEEAKHFQEETHPQKGGGPRLAKMTIDDIVRVTKKGLETVGLNAAAAEVTKENVRRYLPWLLHELSKKGVSYNIETRQAHVNENIRGQAAKLISLFEQAQKQLENLHV